MVNKFGSKCWQRTKGNTQGKSCCFRVFKRVLRILGSQEMEFCILYNSMCLFSWMSVCVFYARGLKTFCVFSKILVVTKPIWTTATKVACFNNCFINSKSLVSNITGAWNNLQNVVLQKLTDHSHNVLLEDLR